MVEAVVAPAVSKWESAVSDDPSLTTRNVAPNHSVACSEQASRAFVPFLAQSVEIGNESVKRSLYCGTKSPIVTCYVNALLASSLSISQGYSQPTLQAIPR